MGRERIWYLSPMRAATVHASLRICAVSPEPPLLAHTSSESRGTFRQKARSLAPLNGWACAVKIYHDGILEDINLLDALQMAIDLDVISLSQVLAVMPGHESVSLSAANLHSAQLNSTNQPVNDYWWKQTLRYVVTYMN